MENYGVKDVILIKMVEKNMAEKTFANNMVNVNATNHHVYELDFISFKFTVTGSTHERTHTEMHALFLSLDFSHLLNDNNSHKQSIIVNKIPR